MVLQEYEIRRGGVPQRVLTYLTAGELESLGGLDPRAVVAVIDEAGMPRINATFREFLHEAISVLAPLELVEAAQEAGNGRVVYVDDRAPEDQDAAAEDIIGWFRVRNGRILADGYAPNPEHKLLSDRGWSAAISRFREPMVRALATRSAAPPPAGSQ